MGRRTLLAWGVLACLLQLQGCSQEKWGQPQDLGSITVRAPDVWTVEEPTSPMRKAQYLLPRAEGDAEDASLIVYYFGPGQGGSVEDNLERWYGQFLQPNGSLTKDRARVNRQTVSGMPVTTADMSGTYAPSAMGPMMPAPDPRPNFRMLAALVESPQGVYYFKLTGPEKTVERWKGTFDRYIGRIQKK